MRTTVYIVRISYVRTPGSCVLSKVESRPVRSGSNLGQLNRRKCTHMSSRIINRHAAPPAYNLIRAVGRDTTSRRRESSRKFSPWLRRAVSTERSEIKQTWRVCATSERGKRKREGERERERRMGASARQVILYSPVPVYMYILYTHDSEDNWEVTWLFTRAIPRGRFSRLSLLIRGNRRVIQALRGMREGRQVN